MAKGSLAGANQTVEELLGRGLNGGAAIRVLIGDFVGTITFYGKVDSADTIFPIGVTLYSDGITIVSTCNADFAGFINTVGLYSVLAKVTAYTSGTATVRINSLEG